MRSRLALLGFVLVISKHFAFICFLMPRRPMYHHLAGSHHGRPYKFCVIVTPHTQQQTQRRARMSVDHMLCHYNIQLPDLWPKLTVNTCHWVPVGSSFLLYVRRTFNTKRNRWELELISFTPSRHVHTRNRTFARPVLGHRQ